ncbi:MAG TPA: tyrosine-type recombinase/integrase [Acidimicrobiales bacterium]|nr:tyrosine-type recombinase/integrase [Acidimicrobiales bacterium]
MPPVTAPPAGRAPLSRAAEAFLADLGERGRAANTLGAYRRDLAAYERFLAARGLTVAHAREEDVAAYLASLAEAGRRPASVARALVSLRSLHRWCGNDAAASVDGPEPAATESAVLSEAEAASLIESAAGSGAIARRDRALLELLYGTGARISEAVGLSVDEVGDGLVRLGGRNPRLVPYGGPAARAVAAWLGPAGWGTMARAARLPGSPWPGAPLFLNQRGGRLSRQWGWSVVRAHGERSGLAGRLGPHVLRHSFAVHLAGRGAPPEVVQRLLVGQPAGPGIGELVAGYRRWHPRGGE